MQPGIVFFYVYDFDAEEIHKVNFPVNALFKYKIAWSKIDLVITAILYILSEIQIVPTNKFNCIFSILALFTTHLFSPNVTKLLVWTNFIVFWGVLQIRQIRGCLEKSCMKTLSLTQ